MKPGGDSGRFDQGYTVCGCGKYAHVYRASTLRRLPKGYNGELCEECSCWMVAVEKLGLKRTRNDGAIFIEQTSADTGTNSGA